MNARLTHVAVVLLTAASLVLSPVCAQAQQAQAEGPQNQSQAQTQATPSSSPEKPSTVSPSATSAPDSARNLKLTEGPDYSKPNPFFPNFIAPYKPRHVDVPMLTNTPRLDQLIQDAKLMLSLDDAISIALQNNLDIYVQRFTPWIAQTQLLKAQAGGVPQSGSAQSVVLGNAPQTSFDPVISGQLNWIYANVPVNNPFLSGLGVISQATPSIVSDSQNINFTYSQGFHTGTSLSISFNNDRSTNNSGQNLFNPAWTSSLTITIAQPLLSGFGILPNTRFILEQKNTVKAAKSQFAQQVITTVTQVANDYWELVYARENVKVEEAAVGVSQKLYEDNKKQLEIGTMAPLDVLTAESQLATDQQNLIVAQTIKLQDETVLLVAITKDAFAGNLKGVEIVPTTPIGTPDVVDNIPLDQAVQEAWTKRPEVTQAELNLKNANIEVRATRNALLPNLTAFIQGGAQGLNGNEITSASTVPPTFAPDTASPVVDPTGAPILVNGTEVFAGFPVTQNVTTFGGLGDALSSLFRAQFPVYGGGINLILPIRNRSAQADNARAQLSERLQEVQLRQLENSILLNVRNALIALQQDRAQVQAAEKARALAQQTLDAEQKKYQLGTSTSYNVVLRARDLTAAQGTELRAKANLEEAAVIFNQAMGRTLEANNIVVADAQRGDTYRTPLIPGTPEPALAGNQ
jgi:outer membrane protein